MSLGDCSHCWSKLCECGWEYRDWPKNRIEELIVTLYALLRLKNIDGVDIEKDFNKLMNEQRANFYKLTKKPKLIIPGRLNN
jgi:hypothetical protein